MSEPLFTSKWSFKHFERVLAFSDGVFAIAITLMVLTLNVPVLIGSSTGPSWCKPYRGVAGISRIFRQFLCYRNWWTVHHRYFQYLIGFNLQLLWLNLLFLLCITPIPFLTNLIVIDYESVLIPGNPVKPSVSMHMKTEVIYIALFAKIRQICTSLKAHQRPLNRGEFCHLIYPIRTPERLPECEYEGRFSEGRAKKGKFTVLLAQRLRQQRPSHS